MHNFVFQIEKKQITEFKFKYYESQVLKIIEK